MIFLVSVKKFLARNESYIPMSQILSRLELISVLHLIHSWFTASNFEHCHNCGTGLTNPPMNPSTSLHHNEADSDSPHKIVNHSRMQSTSDSSAAMARSLPVKENEDKLTENSHGTSFHDPNNSQPQQQNNYTSSISGETQVAAKSMYAIHNSRRPIKKRTRPQLLSETQYHLISPQPSTKSFTHRQPEHLQDEQSFSEHVNHRREGLPQSSRTSVSSEQHHQRVATERDMESVAMSDDEAPFLSSVPTEPAPPCLQRNSASFFPSTRQHQILMKEIYDQNQKISPHYLIPMSSSLSSPQVAGSDVFYKKVFFQDCFEDEGDEDDEQWIGEDALQQMYRAVLKLIPEPMPPRLATTESDSMCIMMKGLFEPSSHFMSLERAMEPKRLDRAMQRGDVESTPPAHTKDDMSDNFIEGAFSMMQQDMITTPKRSFRFKGNSFSSFASSASGSSRSSCVTPSPAKRMMTSALKREIEMPDPSFGHSSSRSLGSFDGSSKSVCRREGYSKASAPPLPELADSVKALERVSNRYWLTDQQKIDRVKQFISIPSKPKLPPRHIGRTTSATKSRRTMVKGHSDGRFGSKRSFSEKATRNIKRHPQDDSAFGAVIRDILKSDAVGATLTGEFGATGSQSEHVEKSNDSDHIDGISSDADFTSTEQLSSQGFGSHFSLQGSNNSSERGISWVGNQQQTFNPYEISTPDSGSSGSGRTASIRASKKTPRSVAQF
jgi:hypothetical protein